MANTTEFERYVRDVTDHRRDFDFDNYERVKHSMASYQKEMIEEVLSEKGIHKKTVCGDCGQRRFYNQRAETFYCPACN